MKWNIPQTEKRKGMIITNKSKQTNKPEQSTKHRNGNEEHVNNQEKDEDPENNPEKKEQSTHNQEKEEDSKNKEVDLQEIELYKGYTKNETIENFRLDNKKLYKDSKLNEKNYGMFITIPYTTIKMEDIHLYLIQHNKKGMEWLLTCEEKHKKPIFGIWNHIPPGLLVILTPIILGFLFGVNIVTGLLVGGMVSGVQIAISSSNTGGAWDNAKKYIEKGNCGGKGTEAHTAAIIGDTVGDPLKDTSGPAINILMKLMAIISVVFANFFIKNSLPALIDGYNI